MEINIYPHLYLRYPYEEIKITATPKKNKFFFLEMIKERCKDAGLNIT